MRIKYLLLLFLGFIVTKSVSQNHNDAPTSIENLNAATVDPRISEVFGNQLQALVLNVPNRLKDLNDILTKRVKIEDMKAEKDEKYPKLSSVPLYTTNNPDLKRDTVVDENTFNPLKYEFRFHARTTVIYRIDNTDKVIVIYPQPVLKK